MITFKRFDFFLASPEEWRAYHVFRRRINTEQTPDEPLIDDRATEISRQGVTITFKIQIGQFGIFLDRLQIGYIYWSFYTPESPSYKGNEKNAFFEIRILNKYHKMGIGTLSLQILMDECKAFGREIFLCECIIPEAKSFFKAIGAKDAQIHHENKLLIKKVENSLLKTWIKEGKEKNPKTKIKIFETNIPNEYIEEFAKSFNESGNDQPRGELDIGDEVVTVQQIRDDESVATKAGFKIFTCMTIENDGKISGATQLKMFPGREKILGQSLTGVPNRYRGRKIGKWVKAEMLLYIKEHYPECEEIKTGNAQSNIAMLHINTSLGFRKYKEMITYQITSVQIQNYIRSKKIAQYEII